MPICTFKLIAGFAKNPAYDVYVILSGRGEFSERLDREKIRYRIIPFVRLRSVGFLDDFLKFCFGWIFASIKIYRYVKSNAISIVHFSDLIDAPFYPSAKWGGAAVVAHVRMCISNPVHRKIFSFVTMAYADKIICISNAVKTAGTFSDKKTTVVLDPGPDYSIFDPVKASHERPPQVEQNKIRAIAIAKFVEAKGHDYFVNMAGLVETELPGKIQFIIVGDKEKGHERFYVNVMDAARHANVLQSITVLGQVRHEEIPSILSDSDIFVHLPRCQEGLGGVILEAMAMGLPVVAFDSGGVRECFRDTTDGFLVKQFDVGAAAKSVVRLAQDPGLRKAMGAAAQEYVRANFTLCRHVGNVEKVYQSIVG